ncbi:MAG: type 4a pilus biogenesis protein PilO [Planctomycetaceae bacterium]
MNNNESQQLKSLGWGLHAAGASVAVALLLGIHGLVLSALRAENTRLEQQITVHSDYNDTASMISARHETLRAALTDRQNRLEELLTRIPESPRESEFLAQLTQLARQSGMTISQYTPGKAQQEKTHADLEVSLQADASYESICRFLYGLADLPRLCHVTSLSLAAPAPEQTIYPVEMTLRIFYTPFDRNQNEEVPHG